MSFLGEIDSDRHKNIWSKTILALSLISDQIKFCISESTIALSAISNTKTNNGEIVFNKNFFGRYQVNLNNCISEGFDNETLSYSFIVNASHLSILFKNFDITSSIKFIIKFNDSFKMLTEIKRKMILKQYQINYQPIRNENETSHIIKEYKHLVNTSDRVKHLIIEQVILKNFFDIIPLSTEDFKIEIKNDKVIFNGFTKQILRDKQYLKQPMSITISLSLNELVNSNISSDSNYQINFKLKFFKVFINLVNFIGQDNDNFDIYFKEPGDPILFELNNNPYLLINFLQLTNDSSDNVRPMFKNYELHKRDLQQPIPSIQRTSMHTPELETQGMSIDRLPTEVLGFSRPVNYINNDTRMSADYEINQINFNDDDNETQEFGPTQVDEIKSIFD